MNSYTANSLISNLSKPTGPSILYIILPLIIGCFIDIFFSQIMGSQYCSLNKNTEYSCVIYGIHILQWKRELIRFVIQLVVIIGGFFILQTYMPSYIPPFYTSLNGSIGLIMFLLIQTDFFIDFRRLCNGLVFALKHN